MKTYIINLPHRKDRIEQIQVPQYLAFPEEIEIFEATNGKEKFTDEPNKRMRGHFGCWDSHRRLLEKISKENNEWTMVLEDDCDFDAQISDFSHFFKELPHNWDLLYLGGINQDAPRQYSEHLDYAKNILQTHAYIVRDKFVPVLLETLNNRKWKADIVFSDALKKGKCFIANPVIAVQRQSFSDITNS